MVRSVISLLWLAIAISAPAAIRLPAIFSAHAVLQRSDATPIWGWADPEEKIVVEFGNEKASTTADAKGAWRLALDLTKAGAAPGELIVGGKNKVVVPDVIVGDVWFCAGQSNMEWLLRASDSFDVELKRPAGDRLRQFLVKRGVSLHPKEDCEGEWMVADAATIGRFSAVAYHFGSRIHRETGTTIGLINSSSGGTPIEAWMSVAAFEKDPDLSASLKRRIEAERNLPKALAGYRSQLSSWSEKFSRPQHPSDSRLAGAEFDGNRWDPVNLPGKITGPRVPPAGSIWLRRTFTVPSEEKPYGLERGFLVAIGYVAGAVEVYWNSVKFGESALEGREPRLRRFALPKHLLRRGSQATLAIRVFNPIGGFEIAAANDGAFTANDVPLRGDWHATAEYNLPAASPAALSAFPPAPNTREELATRVYNAQVAPLAGYGLRGMVWYQGESNVDRAEQYGNAFRLLIEDWREKWGDPGLPFYFCQIAGHSPGGEKNAESKWAELRESQTSALRLANTAQAVLIDCGDPHNLHPSNKQVPGERLARIALHRDYGLSNIIYEGPAVASIGRVENALRIHFANAAGGLVVRRPTPEVPEVSTAVGIGPLKLAPGTSGFVICGPDHRWVPGWAQVEGETVLVWSDEISDPVAVRYAWAGNPVAPLYNSSGLPAAPFRTDRFPLSTTSKKY